MKTDLFSVDLKNRTDDMLDITVYIKKGLDVVDEIIIVDTGSTDRTIEIAKQFGAKIFFYKWNNDFSEVRNESLNHATGDWILILDADEKLDPNSKDNLRAILTDPEDKVHYKLFIRNYLDKDKKEYLDHYGIRLFPNYPDVRFVGAIHEQPILKGSVGLIISKDSILIHHIGYIKDIKEEKQKNQRNIPILKKELEEGIEEMFSFQLFNLGVIVEDIEESINYFKQSIEKATSYSEENTPPHIYAAYCFLLKQFIITKKVDEAIEFINKALEKIPKIQNYPDFWASVGLIYALKEENEKAIEYLKKALDTYNDESLVTFALFSTKSMGSWSTMYNIGILYWKLQQFKEAQNWFLKVLSEDKNNIPATLAAARVSFNAGNFNKSIDLYKKLIEIDPQNKILYYTELSNIYLQMNRIYDMIMCQYEIHDLDIVKKNAYNLASINENSNQLNLAIESYSAIITLMPNEVEALLKRALCYHLIGEQQLAFNDLETIRIKDIKDSDILYKIGIFYIELGELDLGIESFNRGLEINPEHYDIHLYLAYMEELGKTFDKAQERLETLIDTYPHDLRAYIQLGNLLINQGNFQKATSIFENALKIDENNFYLYYALGVSLLQQSKFPEATKYLEKAATLNPNDENIINALKLSKISPNN